MPLPDVRVDDKSLIAPMSAQWPVTLAFAENTLCGRTDYAPTDVSAQGIPQAGSRAYDNYAAFENALAAHRETFFRDDTRRMLPPATRILFPPTHPV